jgi:general secretion pathway protein K
LKRPYSRKNAAFDSLDELHKLRGFNDDFWSTFIEPDPDRPEKRTVTVWGQGTINVNTANPQTLLAFICSTAPQAAMCVDPVEAQKFLMMVTLLRGSMTGIPMFSSPQAFLNALASNKGPIGMMLKSIGMQPIPFLSLDQAGKMISVESKLFSMYATGVVKAGKRETRVRVHAVVDFRNAPPPGAATTIAQMAQANNALGGANGPSAPISGAAQPPPGSAPNPNDPNAALQSLLKPTPGGTVIHYKVE